MIAALLERPALQMRVRTQTHALEAAEWWQQEGQTGGAEVISQTSFLYLLLIVPAMLTWLAQARVRKTYDKYLQVEASAGRSGIEIARWLLARNGMERVKVERAPTKLADHYDPQSKILRLSDEVAQGGSLTSLGIVAHEVGHALQDEEGYSLHRLRNRLAQPLSVMAQVSPFLFIGGFWFGISSFMVAALLMLAGMAVFALITLPVERDASRRAEGMLREAGLAEDTELKGVRRVLRSAAYTYLANLGRRAASFLFFVGAVGAGRGFFG